MPNISFHIRVAQARDKLDTPRDRAVAFRHRKIAREKYNAMRSDSVEFSVDGEEGPGSSEAELSIGGTWSTEMTGREMRELYDELETHLKLLPQTAGGLSDG